MSLVTSSRQNIRLLLPDVVLAGTTFKQVAYVIGQSWSQSLATGEVAGVIEVVVKRYAVDATKPDGLGAELAEFNPRQPVRLIGDNNTLLYADAAGGVALQRTTEAPADWLAAVEAKANEVHPRPVILQGDGLGLMLHQQVNTADEISRHLAAAPAHHWAPKDAQGQPILPTS